MFGLVLESLCGKIKKKEQGVHYTPPAIASFMATEGIGRLIADRLDIDYSRIKDFLNSSGEGLSEVEAQQVLTLLETIKILDPAVGSGSLLIACLETLIEISQKCNKILGEGKRRGSLAWSKLLRGFVQNSLHGVDIDEEAVEITKLRLWLSLVVEDDQTLRPLPDLTRNICCGDSLSAIYQSKEERINPEVNTLEFSTLEKAKNHLSKISIEYKSATGRKVRELRRELESAERDLARIMNQAQGSEASDSSSPEISSFRWDVRFNDVFMKHKNMGFDLVIANPPYVRIQNLDHMTKENYIKRFESLTRRNFDLYMAFVEQSLELAGLNGIISFITPNFAKSQAAEPLRKLLQQRGAIEVWLDFDDNQVFDASVYVSILFATSSKRARKTFKTKCLPTLSDCDFDDSGWNSFFVEGSANYVANWGHISHSKIETSVTNSVHSIDKSPNVLAPSIWRTGTSDEIKFALKLEKGSKPLGELCDIHIGFQTSKDDVFIVNQVEDLSDSLIYVKRRNSNEIIKLEKTCLMRISKQSEPYSILSSNLLCIWPYDLKNKLITQEVFMSKYPLTWDYLLAQLSHF